MGVSRRNTKTADRTSRSRRGMHICPKCDSALVQPTHWYEQGSESWHVDLRCPECEWWGSGAYSQPKVDRFDEELDHGAQALIENLRSLTRANMEDEANRFVTALAGDLILPEDF